MVALRVVLLSQAVLILGACSMGATNSFPTPGSFNPLATTHPVDPGLVAVGREVRETDRTIDTAQDDGRLSKRDARSLHRANGALAATARRLAEDGLNVDEQRSLELQARLIGSVAGAANPAGRSDDRDDSKRN